MICARSPRHLSVARLRSPPSVPRSVDRLKVEGADIRRSGRQPARSRTRLSARSRVLYRGYGTSLYDSRCHASNMLDHFSPAWREAASQQACAFAGCCACRRWLTGSGCQYPHSFMQGRWRDPAHHEPKWLDNQQGQGLRAHSIALAEQASEFTGKVDAGTNLGACAHWHMDLPFSEGLFARVIPRSTAS